VVQSNHARLVFCVHPQVEYGFAQVRRDRLVTSNAGGVLMAKNRPDALEDPRTRTREGERKTGQFGRSAASGWAAALTTQRCQIGIFAIFPGICASVLLFGFHPGTAVGTDLLYASVTKTCGTAVHHLGKTVEWRVVGWLGARSLPVSLLTLLLISRLLQSSSTVPSLISYSGHPRLAAARASIKLLAATVE
jgi:hypothetical protein